MKTFKVAVMAMVLVLLAMAGSAVAAESADKQETVQSEKININTAMVQELDALKRVGEKIAARIVEYRTANGNFKNPEDLMQVKGIGEKVFEMNKDLITIE
jgi:competence protein ComEA